MASFGVRKAKIDLPDIVSWSTGTVEQISAMLDAHYAGKLDVNDYWSVGDERTVSLSAMSATGVDESHSAQNVTFMILHGKNMFDLTESGYSGKKNACVIGMKNCLATKGRIEQDASSSTVSQIGWKGCSRRAWCDNVFKEALPSDIKALFKQFSYQCLKPSTFTEFETLSNYFTLPSMGEVWDSGYDNYTQEGTQMDYYAIGQENRIKNLGDSASSGARWWVRSVGNYQDIYWCNILEQGQKDHSNYKSPYGISPFGCI